MGETGEALERIVARWPRSRHRERDRGLGAGAGDGLDQVNTAINQMDQVTQQNAAMVEESTAASHALSRETEELSSLVGRFQLGTRSAAAPVRTARRGRWRPGRCRC